MIKRTSLKRKGTINKMSQKYKEGKEQRIADGQRMMDLFNLHWDAHLDKKCEACGKQLWGDNNTCYHDHLLEKSNHPELKFEIENLFLVCPDCHNKKGDGNPMPKHKIAIEQAKRKFLNNESSNNQSGKR